MFKGSRVIGFIGFRVPVWELILGRFGGFWRLKVLGFWGFRGLGF